MTDILSFRPPASGVAFVAGANGISGRAIIEHLVREPLSKWSKIIITSRRPLKMFHLDSRVEFIALDFLDTKETIVEKIKDICKDVTHAFFTSYIHNNDFSKLHEKNGPLFRNFLESVDEACPDLKRVVLQTGGKHYGFQFRDVTMPLVESLSRYVGPGSIFYYEQEDDMFAIQKRHIGLNEALPIAQYVLICRELNQPPKSPGTLDSYHRVEQQSYAPSIADLTIWAATQDHCKDEVFNHANGDVIYFKIPTDAMDAVEPHAAPMDMAEWAKDKRPVWEKIVERNGGDVDSFQLDSFELMNWYITPSLQKAPFITTVSKARQYGWNRYDDSYKSWMDTIRVYENTGVLPVP
ncbi:hypothetical protein BJX99DRAFT_266740 [Aspergillus californicus]